MFTIAESVHYTSVTAYIEALVKMPADLRNALAFSVPSLRLTAKRGQVQTLFADTNATANHIHLFLRDSTKTSDGTVTTAPKRDWKTAERPPWAWQEIYDWMLEKKYVSPYSVGPDSYPYLGSAWQNLAVYFLSQPVPNLDAPRVYADDISQVEMDE